MANSVTSHYFHAEAHALVGKLKLPFEEQIKKQAFVKLEGNLADLAAEERAQRNYFSQNAENFRLEGIVSYASAHTQVSGHESDKHTGASVTLATSVVEDINVLNVVTADRVVAQVSLTHIPGEYSPHITFLGTHFENLRIARHKAEPYLRLDVAGARAAGRKAMPVDQGTDLMKAIEAQYKRLKARFDALTDDDRIRMRFTNAEEWLKNKYHGFALNYEKIKSHALEEIAKDEKRQDEQKKENAAPEKEEERWNQITGSLVENVEIKDISVKAADGKSIQIPPPATTFGHVIHIPDFGNVFLAELTVTHNSYHLTMIRLEMGCLSSGSVSIGECHTNGKGSGGH